MRRFELLFLSFAAAGLMAGSAMAQTHVLVPGSDKLVNPTTDYDQNSGALPSALPATPGLQSGDLGIASGGLGFPRRTPQPGSQAGETSTVMRACRTSEQELPIWKLLGPRPLCPAKTR